MLAETPETSRYSSAYDRIQDWIQETSGSTEANLNGSSSDQGPSHIHSGWLAPICLDGDGYAGAVAGRRASDNGLLSIPLEKYLEFVDWSGRQLRADKRGAIPDDLASILERLGLASDRWLDGVEKFGSRFGKVVGCGEQVTSHARRFGRRWSRGITACREAFGRQGHPAGTSS